MLKTLLGFPLPIIDDIFEVWGIPVGFSKLVVLFSMITALLIARLSVSSSAIVLPTTFLFLIGCAVGTHWMLADVVMDGLYPFQKILVSLTLGQSIGGLFMLAFFKTGDKQIAGM